MSLSIDVYLPELSIDTVTKAVNLLSDHGLDLRLEPSICGSDPHGWKGLIPVEVDLSRLERPALISKKFKTVFSFDLHAFNFNQRKFNSAEADVEIMRRVEACTEVVTITASHVAPAAFAISASFAAALADAGRGIIFDCWAGRFNSDIQDLPAVLRSNLVEQFYEKYEKVSHTKLRKLFQRVEQAGQTPGFCAYQNILIRLPVKDFLLQYVGFSTKSYSNEIFQLYAVFLPLYVEHCTFDLTYSVPLENPQSYVSPKFWRLSDEQSIILAINTQANAFFKRATSALEFAAIASDICDNHDERVNEDIAISYAQGADLFRARFLLQLLNAKYWVKRKHDALNRIGSIKKAINTSAEQTQHVLREQTRANIKLLKLEGIQSLIGLDSV